MQKLNFPQYKFKVKKEESIYSIFDEVRKKYILLTPEEWVRQHIIHYLHLEKKYPFGIMAVEKKLPNTKKRTDIVIYGTSTPILPNILIECKAPHVALDRTTIEQTSMYYKHLNPKIVWMCNGVEDWIIDFSTNKSISKEGIPIFKK